jgi:formate hydrogenlyase subunit 3/multisubunit Na+/H+ antiporter MnhD subunit
MKPPVRLGPFSFPSPPVPVMCFLCVNDQNHSHEHHHGHPHTPRWRRVHHSWIFWVAVFLMLLGIITYVMTGDLFWALHRQ